MPGPLTARNKLGQAAVTLDQKVRRHTHFGNAGEIGMHLSGQLILEEPLHPSTPKFARWQADVMDHQQGDLISRAAVAVW